MGPSARCAHARSDQTALIGGLRQHQLPNQQKAAARALTWMWFACRTLCRETQRMESMTLEASCRQTPMTLKETSP